ncbi:aspartate--ammonia ligase [Nephila pilipes]|uniref:Aspartate--ammonia ligase n=1 Tax=Nephila pilipes TaxID=299642 RepID=A0A8X6MYA1_NEPPI|nr:aspartate--ammonia ligase [Nephila pilipes]
MYKFEIVRGLYANMNAIRRDERRGHSFLLRRSVGLESQKLPGQIVFISAQEMEDEYPQLTPKERETVYTRKHRAIFVSQVGKTLKSGGKHDDRAPDYDDWDLNGDILVHHEGLHTALELSSMGIRVTKDSLINQLTACEASNRLDLQFHKCLTNGRLPHYTIGGGIGQSRLCMYLLDKIHIGEVQASLWDKKTLVECTERNITLL